MSGNFDSIPKAREPSVYEIRIKGHLSEHSAEWFEGMALTSEEGGLTLLTGPVRDDAALHGLLKRVRDLGMPLISVNRVDPDPADASQ
jgi:hypothetical protein